MVLPYQMCDDDNKALDLDHDVEEKKLHELVKISHKSKSED